MTPLRLGLFALRSSCIRPLLPSGRASRSAALFCDNAASGDDEAAPPRGRQPKPGEMLRAGDIYPDIAPQTSIQYMESEAYHTAYGEDPVWKQHWRNFKGQFPPETRKTCIRGGVISTGNPCPICRDEYLVVHYTNVKLLDQFISPHTGEILPTKRTSICQKQMKLLKVAVEKAQDYGFIETAVPFKKYNYTDYLEVKSS